MLNDKSPNWQLSTISLILMRLKGYNKERPFQLTSSSPIFSPAGAGRSSYQPPPRRVKYYA